MLFYEKSRFHPDADNSTTPIYLWTKNSRYSFLTEILKAVFIRWHYNCRKELFGPGQTGHFARSRSGPRLIAVCLPKWAHDKKPKAIPGTEWNSGKIDKKRPPF